VHLNAINFLIYSVTVHLLSHATFCYSTPGSRLASFSRPLLTGMVDTARFLYFFTLHCIKYTRS